MKKYLSTDITGNINGGKERESQQSTSVTILHRNATKQLVLTSVFSSRRCTS